MSNKEKKRMLYTDTTIIVLVAGALLLESPTVA